MIIINIHIIIYIYTYVIYLYVSSFVFWGGGVGNQNLQLWVLGEGCFFCNSVAYPMNATFCRPVVTELDSVMPRVHIYIYIYITETVCVQ